MKRVSKIAFMLLVSQPAMAAELGGVLEDPAGRPSSDTPQQDEQPPTLVQWVPQTWSLIPPEKITLYQEVAEKLQNEVPETQDLEYGETSIQLIRTMHTPKYSEIDSLTQRILIMFALMPTVTSLAYETIAPYIQQTPSGGARVPLWRKVAVIASLQEESYRENSHFTLLDMMAASNRMAASTRTSPRETDPALKDGT
jgi:hypothetical protein